MLASMVQIAAPRLNILTLVCSILKRTCVPFGFTTPGINSIPRDLPKDISTVPPCHDKAGTLSVKDNAIMKTQE